MRYLAAFIIVLTACSTAPATRTPPQVVEFLLTSAATDFHASGPAGPLRFRDVHIGRVTNAAAEEQYILCGQFLRGTGEWTPFATIKTSGYEQWVGAQAAAYCQSSSVKRDHQESDLSQSLQTRLDSLR